MTLPVQTSFALKTRGGFRAGAGRKPSRESGPSHLARPELSRHHPVHTTLRLERGCWNLRSRRALLALQGAFEGGRDRFGFRLIHYSVQGNHLHLIVEASGKQSLSRGMQGLTIRMARALNRMMQRQGKVFAERFHAHVLGSRREVANALRYVFGNFAHHSKVWGLELGKAFCDPFSSAEWFAVAPPDTAPVAAPDTWLLRVGWRGAVPLKDARRPRARTTL